MRIGQGYDVHKLVEGRKLILGGVVDGKEVTMQVKAGDKVIYSKYSGTEVELEKEKYVIVKQSDILAVVE